MSSSFLHWWQHIPETLNPVLLQIGPVKLQYYGLMYLVAFGLSYYLVCYRIKNEKGFTLTLEQAETLTTAMIFGVILGGRLGYVLFYNFSHYLHNPLEIFLPFDFSDGIRFTGISGMSYHGGLLGVVIAAIIYGRKSGVSFWEISDLYCSVVPLGYTFGRIGNFINGELYGRVTTASIGMFFPHARSPELRHPSQLYEAFFEGIVSFAILWTLRKRIHIRGAMLSLYLITYGVFRFFIEYFREPDEHLGFIAWHFSMGQVLCSVMILTGISLLVYRNGKQRSEKAVSTY